jgi:hypothetical protein
LSKQSAKSATLEATFFTAILSAFFSTFNYSICPAHDTAIVAAVRSSFKETNSSADTPAVTTANKATNSISERTACSTSLNAAVTTTVSEPYCTAQLYALLPALFAAYSNS